MDGSILIMETAICGMKTPVIVIGGGWAGMTAARALAQAGTAVVLIERNPYPGGRAFSFSDSMTDRVLDNGQHVLLGCCTAMQSLIDDLGCHGAVRFQPALDLPVFFEDVWTRLYSHSGLQGPLHLLPGLLGYRALPFADRLRALGMGLRMRGQSGNQILDHQTFAGWLGAHHQSRIAIERLWDLVGVSVLNCRADRLSAEEALNAFRLGVLPGHRAARLGFFTRPLKDLADAMIADLLGQGVVVRLGSTVEAIAVEAGRATGVVVNSAHIAASAVIAAVPHDGLQRLLPKTWARHAEFAAGLDFEWSGILNWYLLFQEPVWQGTVFAVADATNPFVFNRGAIFDPGGVDDGRLLGISVSDAPMAPGRMRAQLLESLRATLERALPATRKTPLLGQRVVVQPHATFRASPGAGQARPRAHTELRGLYLAGDWTHTGWPASLEGAVRSGDLAAREVLTTENG